jgi:hypothetical protein
MAAVEIYSAMRYYWRHFSVLTRRKNALLLLLCNMAARDLCSCTYRSIWWRWEVRVTFCVHAERS